jgi:hypothetical protein
MSRIDNSPVVRRHQKPLPDFIRARLVNSVSFYFTNLHDATKGGGALEGLQVLRES